MSGNCEKCLKSVSKRIPGIKCGMCVSIYHIKCVDISDEVLQDIKRGSANWVCIDCRSRANISIIDGVESNDNISDPHNAKISDLISILKGMQIQLDSLKDSSNYVCETLDDLKGNMSQLSKDAQLLNQRLTYLEQKFNVHEAKMNIMEAHMDRPAQCLNENNLVVCGIPSNCENITGMVVNIVNVLGIEITNDDLLSVKQMVHSKESVSQLKNSFIVSFKSIEMKNNILNSFRKNKTLYTNQLAVDFSNGTSNQRIFLLQHLTKFQSKLYNAAKIIKNNFKFQFLWCKENNIYLRKSVDSKIHQIISFNDISRINSSLQHSSASSPSNASAANTSAHRGQSTSASLLSTSISESNHHD